MGSYFRDGAMGSATLGCFVLSENGELFAVTADHVTSLSQGEIYYLVRGEILVPLGKLYPKQDDASCPQYDLSVFPINQDQLSRVDTDFRNLTGEACDINLFCGSKQELYDQTLHAHVFRENAVAVDPSEITSTESDSYSTQTVRVAAGDAHQKHSESLSQYHFLVENKDRVLVPGDSGCVLFQTSPASRIVTLVGVVRGQLQEEPDFIVCALLFKGFEALELNLKTKFKFNNGGSRQKWFDSQKVCHGSRITFYLPKHINQQDFDLLHQIHVFIDTTDWQPTSQRNDLQHDYEKRLFKAVHRGEDIENDMADSPDHKSFHCLMLACQQVYRCQFELAENTLKKAYRCIAKGVVCRSKLMAKLVQITALMLLRNGDTKSMGKLYEISDSFMRNVDTSDLETMRVLGYYFMNFAWYFDRQGKQADAFDLAEKCLDLFRAYSGHTREQLQGYFLSHVLLARLNLNCGEFFDRRHKLPHIKSIGEAEKFIKNVTGGDDFPVVQTHFRLALCELYFRKGQRQEALDVAVCCKAIASRHKLGDAERQAQSHIAALVM